jgi:hypothetical protein
MMRTLVLNFIACLVFAGVTHGQSTDPLQFEGQLWGGLCASQVHGDGISGFNKFGATGGVGVKVWRGDEDRRVSGLILFTQKGSRRVPNTKQGDFDTWRYRFTYIDLPLIREWQFSGGWWVGIGLQPSYLIKGEEDFYAGGYTDLTYVDLKPWDIGGVVTAGLPWTDRAALEIRLSQSLLPISEQPEQPVVRFDNFMMNLAIQVAASIHIGG